MNETERSAKASRLWPKLLVYFAVIGTWLILSRLLPLDEWFVALMGRIEAWGVWGLVAFVLLYVPCCVLMLPDLLPNAAAGAIWGVGVGAVAVSLGRVLGSTATFLLARTVAASWIERRTATDAKFAAVSEAIGREGFKVVVLLRLCPLFPVILLNYALGLTPVRLRTCAVATLLAMIPRTFVVAYVGSGARSLADLAAGEAEAQPAQLALFWGGLVASLIVVAILVVKARRMLNAALAGSE
ncbi:MAG TPA: TVP38/TMEM64 family protein [Candidatus Hydrogenedentes bacterium]|nr:TVP38/TMEM64 family protein [Candidatus Hydrogenedentota bacterium]HPG67028.1 TVP38/TMEM64 family protein [Candidatus Hydrogenedentota bacterium]